MDHLIKRFPHYSKLLRLYPVAYQKEYGEQMLQTLADMLDDPHEKPAAVWARTVLDYPISIMYQQLSYTEANMQHNPQYIKRTAVLGAWLVAPFFLFVVVNGTNNHWLEHSMLWHTNFLLTWLVLLPSIAVILNLAALLRWVRQQRNTAHASAWKALTDVRRTWPLIAIALIGLGILAIIFGHDSVHCITGNPIRELRNLHQTLQCIQRS